MFVVLFYCTVPTVVYLKQLSTSEEEATRKTPIPTHSWFQPNSPCLEDCRNYIFQHPLTMGVF